MSVLPIDHLEKIEGWGGAVSSFGYVYRPATVEGLREVFELARRSNRNITFRGSGRSYGDAALGAENIVLDTSRMNRILSWDPNSGIITMEPGVTIEQLWQYIIEDGWWPPVVSGTMYPTVGGCLGMNIHGKNNFKAGPIGEHVLSFDIMLPSGEIKTATPDSESELFYSAISGFGMFGVFTSITMQMKKVYSGLLHVKAWTTKNLHELFEIYQQHIPGSDYLVGWVDCISSDEKLGRSIVHQANYFKPGEDQNPAQSLRVSNQSLPNTILGIFPKSFVWMLLRPFTNNAGMKFINWLRVFVSRLPVVGKPVYEQSHAEFAFLLDYVPGWKKSYGQGGLIQYQSFIPKESAEKVFRKQIEMCQEAGLPPYLGVFKQHKPDKFLFTHSVDGFSLALDFKVTEKNREKLWSLCAKMNDVVLANGGRFYFAKDATLRPQDFKAFLGEETLKKFAELKKRYDPENILQTDLSRRLVL
ncbi:MAG: FAD-binding oxidoreductase [Bacteroidota bacterium]|nr:FAD-binding oxidoreductase [Bacteroidota bacterium]MDP4230939.1 FAD-binding oxidoreductase [Bacteroidota bacterium]MDP4237094.1 FAD-binding oxidoreductase [Bacteroidota bacterium]